MNYSNYIQNLIEQSHTSIEDLAQSLELTVPAIKKILAGNVKHPSTQTIEKLAEIKHVSSLDIVQEIYCNIPTLDDGLTEEEIDFITTSQRYICYLYLNGYNVDFNISFTTLDNAQIIFPGMATKKREPNNKILIDSFTARSLIYNNKPKIEYDNLIDFLSPLFLIDKINTFKRVDIVTGSDFKNIIPFINVFKSHPLPLKFKLNIIHFDSTAGKVLETISLT